MINIKSGHRRGMVMPLKIEARLLVMRLRLPTFTLSHLMLVTAERESCRQMVKVYVYSTVESPCPA